MAGRTYEWNGRGRPPAARAWRCTGCGRGGVVRCSKGKQSARRRHRDCGGDFLLLRVQGA